MSVDKDEKALDRERRHRRDPRQGVMSVDKDEKGPDVEAPANRMTPEPANDSFEITTEWQGLWLATIARAWQAMSMKEGPERTWLDNLLSNDPFKVRSAIEQQGNNTTALPNSLDITVQESDSAHHEYIENNKLILILPAKPEDDALQATMLVTYLRSGRVYPFTTF